MFTNSDFKKKISIIIPYIGLLFFFIILIVFTDKNISLILDSDMSSEMLLANVLSKEHALLSNEWFYSTELRVLNTQLVFTPLFWITSNWHLIRVLGSIICWLLLILSYHYLCRQLRISEYFAISAIWLILPFSCVYFAYVITGLYYIPHITISFLSLGLIFNYINSESKKSLFILILLCLLSLGAGMGGPRQLLILYIPLVLTDIILFIVVRLAKLREESTTLRKFVISSFTASIFSVLGYLINGRILSRIYSFKSWDILEYKEISLDSIMDVINGFLAFFGYLTEDVFSIATIVNMFTCFLLILVVLVTYFGIKKKGLSDEYYVTSIFFTISILVFTLLYTLTTMVYAHKYNVPVLILAIPLTIMGLKELNLAPVYKKLLGLVLILGVLISCTHNYRAYIKGSAYESNRTSNEYSQITDLLLNQGYTEGYATFWNGNVLTELSDGKIDVWVWEDSSAENVEQVSEWLQLKEHLVKSPEGRVFAMLRTDRLDKIAFYPALDTNKIIYQSDRFIVYGYESRQELIDDSLN